MEIQKRLHDMAKRNVLLNRLSHQIHAHLGDIKDAPRIFGHGEFDVVTCNPPYLVANHGRVNENEYIAAARHEIHCSLEDAIRASAQLVKSGGKVAFVHRPSRFAELVTLMRKYRVEPKRIRFVHPKVGSEANMALIEGTRDGKPDLKLLPPLIVYEEDGRYTQEIMDIYYGQG